MRDLILTLFILASLPVIVKTPAVGGLMWIWVSVMSPHTQGWSYATQLPFAYIIAIATVLGLLVSRQPKNLPLTPISLTLLAFVLWMNITALFALLPDGQVEQWYKVMKIMLMTFVVLMVIKTRQDVLRLIWVLVLSLGYYGVKGGIFTIKSGGTDRVWGPEMTFIADNNACALALIMTIPLMYYLQQMSANKWLRRALTAMMLLSALAALASYSRGGLLAIAAMALFMWSKSGKKLALGGLLVLAIPLFLGFMPAQWDQRMDSIGDYETDSSAQGRFNAWNMAYNLAKDRFFGGGFDVAEPSVFYQYAPHPLDIHAAHSIYFQALGEHGFVGLALYLMLGVLTWRSASWIARKSRSRPDLRWACGLATMVQASLIGFSVGGAFLSLLYFDVPYYLMVAIVVTRILVERALQDPPAAEPVFIQTGGQP
ncbi:putative inorganic carbon (HCO3(-)) transporter [Oxalobacteraceae bacterium GrIS 1.11]